MALCSSIQIIASDGIVIAATLLSPTDKEVRAVIQFHSGTVIRKEFYLKFCSYLCDCGYIVILFDYRGVGASRPVNLRGFKASISDWGQKDATSVLNWIRNKYPDTPIHLLAHSMGGQLMGLMPNWAEFDKITVLASSVGNWNRFSPAYKRKAKWSSLLLFPITLPLFGYAPGIFGLGQDWPKEVALEWSEISRRELLISEYMDGIHGHTEYHRIDKSIVAIFFEDDHMATPLTVNDFGLYLSSANVRSSFFKGCNIWLRKNWTFWCL